MIPRVELAALALLGDGRTLTKYDLSEAAHCHHKTAQRALSKLHDAGQSHIVGWVPIYQRRIANYAGGPGKDVPMPRALTDKEIQRKRRKDPEVLIADAMKKRAKRFLENERRKLA